LLHVSSVSLCHHDVQFSTDLKLSERIGQKLLHWKALHSRACLLDSHILLFLLLDLLPKPIKSISKCALPNVLYLKIQVTLIIEHCEITHFFLLQMFFYLYLFMCFSDFFKTLQTVIYGIFGNIKPKAYRIEDFFFLFYFIFKLYIIVLVLPNIKMNPPQVYMCSPSWTLLPPPGTTQRDGMGRIEDLSLCYSWGFSLESSDSLAFNPTSPISCSLQPPHSRKSSFITM